MGRKSEETNNQPLNEREITIRGMHCANCPVMIERRLKKLPGISSVQASYRTGKARIQYAGDLDLAAVQSALEEEGYSIANVSEAASGEQATRTKRDYAEIAAAFLILIGIALVLQRFGVFSQGFGMSENMSYGLVFLIGLLASVSSCIAVTGGLLLAVSATYNERNPHLTEIQKLRPHIYFNIGRIVSYTALGGVIGALGSALALSPSVNGLLTLLASALMILLGLHMLKLLPARYMPSLPTALAHRIHDLAAGERNEAAFALGAATFFLPCGFTQALQLYVLAKGSSIAGALTMLAFALGTLPALLSLSALSSFAKGAFQQHFLKFAGAAVVMLGLLNIQYGLVLVGSDSGSARMADGSATKQEAAVGKDASQGQPFASAQRQKISMKVVDFDYLPNRFTVTQGVPVDWWIDASEAAGCGRVLIVPRLGIRKFLSANSSTLITFTPQEAGELAFNCGMGMMTPNSKITVVPGAKG